MSAPHGMSRRRSAAVIALVVLATLITFVGSLTVWSKRQLLDNEAWRTSSARLLQQPAVRSALATTLVDQLYANVDVEQQLRQNLPAGTKGLAPELASALQTASTRAAETFLGTARGQQLWVELSGRAHAQLVRALEGKSVRGIGTANGEIVLDLRPMLQRLANRVGVGDRLATALPPDAGRIVLLRSDQLKNAQHAVRVLNALSVVVAIVALALYAIAIWVARGARLRTLAWSGGSLVLVGLLVLIVRRLVGHWITGSLVKTLANRPAVGQAWLIETDLLRDIALALVLYGVVAIVAAWLGSAARHAVALRAWLAPSFRDHAFAVYAVATVVFLALIAWGPSSGSRRVLGTLVLAALLYTGLTLWRRQMLSENAAPS